MSIEKKKAVKEKAGAKKPGSSDFKNREGGSDRISLNAAYQLIGIIKSAEDPESVLAASELLDGLDKEKRKTVNAYSVVLEYAGSKKDLSDEHGIGLAKFLMKWADNEFDGLSDASKFLSQETTNYLHSELIIKRYDQKGSGVIDALFDKKLRSGKVSNVDFGLYTLTKLYNERESSRELIEKHADMIESKFSIDDLGVRRKVISLLGDVNPDKYAEFFIELLENEPEKYATRIMECLSKVSESKLKELDVQIILRKFLSSRFDIRKEPHNPYIDSHYPVYFAQAYILSADDKLAAAKELLGYGPLPFLGFDESTASTSEEYKMLSGAKSWTGIGIALVCEKVDTATKKEMVNLLLDALGNKNPSIVINALDALNAVYDEYEDSRNFIDSNIHVIKSLLNHEDKEVRDSTKLLLYTIAEGGIPTIVFPSAFPTIPTVHSKATIVSKGGTKIRITHATSDKLDELGEILYNFEIGNNLTPSDKVFLEMLGLIDHGKNQIKDIFVETVRYQLLNDGDITVIRKKAQVIEDMLAEGSPSLASVGRITTEAAAWNSKFLFSIVALGDKPFEMNRNYRTPLLHQEGKFDDLVKTAGKILSAATNKELLKAVDEFKEKGKELRKLCGS